MDVPKLTLDQRIFIIQEWYRTENTTNVLTRFSAQFPERLVPSKQAVHKLRRKFEVTGSVLDARKCGRTRTIRTVENTEITSDAFNKSPQKSTRRASSELGIPRTTLQRIMADLSLRPFKPRLIHALNEDDPDRRMQFCELFLGKMDRNRQIFDDILWTDEATFKLNGHINRHNCVYWADANPRLTIEHELNLPGICVWAGVWSEGIVGPFFFDGTVTGLSYLQILTDPIFPVLMDHPKLSRMIWQQDGAPAHFHSEVRTLLDKTFPGRWMGRRGSIEWPPRSPDLTPMDFSIWGILKENVYSQKPATISDLKKVITEEFGTFDVTLCQRICHSVEGRLLKCIQARGNQFEHLE